MVTYNMGEKYDYREAVRNDILRYLEDRDVGYISDEKADEILDDLFVEDSVTGNASGSYTFNRWKAEEYICHNLDLVEEALEEFGRKFCCEAETLDVTVRCHLLGEVFAEVVDEWNKKIGKDAEDEKETEE